MHRAKEGGVLRRGPCAGEIAPGGAPRWRRVADSSTVPCSPPTLIAAMRDKEGPMRREEAKVSLKISKVSF